MTQNGLAAGYFDSGTGFAYDVATSNYYTFGPTNSWVQAVGGSTAGNGYVVGGDGTNYDGFVWSESDQSYVQIPALAAAQGISNNGQLVAGITQGTQAAVYSPSGTAHRHLLGRRGHRGEQQRPGDRRQLGRRL